LAPRPKENSKQKRETREINMALLAGAACTWARSSAGIKTEQSDQETRPSAERSEQVKRTKPLVALGLFFCTERIF
jgi:hypothetical protein